MGNAKHSMCGTMGKYHDISVRQFAKSAPTVGVTTLQDGIVLMLEETYGIRDGSQDLAGVDEDDHSGIHEQLGIIPVVSLLPPLHHVEQVQQHQREQHCMGI